MLAFDDNNRLYIDHECEVCSKFPLENIEEPCLECGVSQKELILLEQQVNRTNKALDLSEKAEVGDIDVRQSWLHLSSIKLGGGNFDQITFTDIDQTDDIRKLADLAEHMCTVVVYPTNIRHIEGDDYLEEELFLDDNEDEREEE